MTSANARVFTLTSDARFVVRLTNYGGIIMSILAPDRDGRLANVVLGHDSVDAYRNNPAYLGAIIGRVANRVAGARFSLDGTEYQLSANDGKHSLHGGRRGFDQVVWNAEEIAGGVRLTHRSPDGDEGYPGNLDLTVTYSVTAENELVVDYRATTDRATPVNLTQHAYFNLAGSGEILNHVLELAADAMTPVDATLIPTGEITPVAGTAFDFRLPRPIGSEYDHNFVVRREGPVLSRERPGPVGNRPEQLARAARLEDPGSGRTLEVFTTEPGIQLYTGNFLETPHTGVTLETQGFPDAPNQRGFPSVILRPGEEYRSRTVFRFGCRP
jgi:aldose 1-epimerase